MKKINRILQCMVLVLLLSIMMGVSEQCGVLYDPDVPRQEGEEFRTVDTGHFIVQLLFTEGHAVVWQPTELGYKQEILVVPAYVGGLPVREIGRLGLSGWRPFTDGALKKIYLPYTLERFAHENVLYHSPYTHDWLLEAVLLPQEYSSMLYWMGKKFYITQEQLDVYGHHSSFNLVNVMYHYNYVDSPNLDYYWIDYIIEDSIFAEPAAPVREGYTFTGWFLEPECITEWDEVRPTSAEQKLKLYAGWISN